MPQYIHMLKRDVAKHVRVVMTAASQRFITPYTLELFSGERVYADMFESDENVRVPHIQLSRWADILLVMPATANIIAKLAVGLCDDLLSTIAVAIRAPIVVVPAMNEQMWFSTVVRQNVERLRSMGVRVLDPGVGFEVADMKPIIGTMPAFPVVAQCIREVMAGAPRR